MRGWLLQRAFVGLLLLAWPTGWLLNAAAQESPVPAAPPPATGDPGTGPPSPGGVEEVQPQVYWFRDEKTGKLIPVPGWTLQQLQALNQQAAKVQMDQPPALTVERLSLEGTVEGSYANLAVEIAARTHLDGWARLDVRLDEAVLQGQDPVNYAGPADQHVLAFDDKLQEHVFWLHAKPDQRHTLKLRVWVPLTPSGGGGARLQLTTPRAMTSQLKLTVPIQRLEPTDVAVNPGRLTEVRPLGDGRVEIAAEGFSGETEVAWSPPQAAMMERVLAVDVTGALLARVDGRSVSTLATLALRARGAGQIQSFRIRLPRGATFVSSERLGYEVLEEPPIDPAMFDGRRVVRVRLNQPSASQVVRFVTEQPHDVNETNDHIELCGFEVFDVQHAPDGKTQATVRQSGFVGIQVVGNWQVLRSGSHNVRQVLPAALPEELPRADIREAYEYLTQPCSLEVRIVPLETRTSVEPQYVFLVRPDRIDLLATLDYTVRGAPAFALDIDLPGWKVGNNGVGPANLVDQQRVAFDQTSPLSVRLLQPATGSLSLVLRATREIPAGAEEISFELPRPRVNTLGPAKVAVLAADNVSLAPRPAGTSGLAPQDEPPQMQLPDERFVQEPLYFRGEGATASMQAAFKVLKRQVSVEVATEAQIDLRGARLEQVLRYQVQYEPLDEIELEVPAILAQAERLAVYLGRERLAAAVVPQADAQPDAPVRLRVPLRSQRIGPFQLDLRYNISWDPLPDDASVTVELPLAMPADGTLSGNRLRAVPRPGISVQPVAGQPWSPRGSSQAPTAGGNAWALELHAQDRAAAVRLAASLEDEAFFTHTRVERAWVQTLLTAGMRRDRAVFRLLSSEAAVEFDLPDGAGSDLQVLLDGRWVQPQLTREGVSVPLGPSSGQRRRVVVELRYDLPAPSGPRLRRRLQPPLPERSDHAQHVYWQVLLPPDEHLMWASPAFTRQYVWQRSGLLWARRPLREQLELESWVGAAHSDDVTIGTNRYVFSAIGPLPPLELQTARRSWIVLVASTAVLVVGLAWIYVPALRRGDVLLALAVLLASAAAVYPEPAVVLLQGASVGLGLVLVSLLLSRVLSRRAGPWVPDGGSALLRREWPSSRRSGPVAVVGSNSSTRLVQPAAAASLETEP